MSFILYCDSAFHCYYHMHSNLLICIITFEILVKCNKYLKRYDSLCYEKISLYYFAL